MKRIQIVLLFVVSALTAVPLSVGAQGSDDLCTFCIDIVEEWLKQGKTQDEIAALVEKVSGIKLHPIVNISKLYYLLLFRFVQPWFYPC